MIIGDENPAEGNPYPPPFIKKGGEAEYMPRVAVLKVVSENFQKCYEGERDKRQNKRPCALVTRPVFKQKKQHKIKQTKRKAKSGQKEKNRIHPPIISYFRLMCPHFFGGKIVA